MQRRVIPLHLPERFGPLAIGKRGRIDDCQIETRR